MAVVFLPSASVPVDKQLLVGLSLGQHTVVCSLIRFDLLPMGVLQTVLDGFQVPEGLGGRLQIVGEVVSKARAQEGGGEQTSGGRIQLYPATGQTQASPVRSVVLFNRPNSAKHHFLTLEPIKLRFTSSRSLVGDEANNRVTEEMAGRDGLQGAIDAINASWEINSTLQSAIQTYMNSGSQSTSRVSDKSAAHQGGRAVTLVRQTVQAAGEFLLVISDGTPAPGLPALKDLSAFFGQVSIRTHQAVALSRQLPSLQRTLPSPQRVARTRQDYIGFFNAVWLVLNDLIVGQALRSLILGNLGFFTIRLGGAIEIATVQVPLQTLEWLNHWPAGLKLNTELSSFACSTLTSLILAWEQVILRRLVASLPLILHLVALSGFVGASTVLALFSDLAGIATAHLYAAYLLATVSYRWMSVLLGGLFDVFRGKRRNVLRKRLDSTSYTVDQLLVGTVLFTTLVFLFPTVLAYYSLVAAGRTVVIFLHAFLETLLAFINHYPLFAIMLRIKSPPRLPGGIDIKPTVEPGILRMENTPLVMGVLLKQHFLLAAQILSVHYSPLRLLSAFFRGETITPLSNLQKADV